MTPAAINQRQVADILAAAERTGYRALKQLLALRKLETQAARAAAPSPETPPTHRNGSEKGTPQTPSSTVLHRASLVPSTGSHRLSGVVRYQGFTRRRLG